MTPAQILDDAIHEFVKAVDGGELAAWVLSFQTTSITDNPDHMPLASASAYSLGPAATAESALGLLRLTQLRIERAIASYDADDDDEEES